MLYVWTNQCESIRAVDQGCTFGSKASPKGHYIVKLYGYPNRGSVIKLHYALEPVWQCETIYKTRQ
jgi:hypothetical protein